MTTVVRPSPATAAPAAPRPLGDYASAYWARVRGGEMGSMPAVLGILVLVGGFSIAKPQSFSTPYNFANLMAQSAVYCVVAMGLVFVLLLGEIDLSAGFASGRASSRCPRRPGEASPASSTGSSSCTRSTRAGSRRRP